MDKKYTLRKANERDVKLLFDWKNEKLCVRNSLSGREVSWEEHYTWFMQALKDKKRKIFILEADEQPVGQIRLDREKDMAVVSYSIAEEFRGQHLGREILCLAERESVIWNIRKLKADVLSCNIPSQKLFLDLGYQESIRGEILCYEKDLDASKP